MVLQVPAESLTLECPVNGWLFGKMPAHGDFISRGLDDDTVAASDAALAEALAMAAHRWDHEWDEVYVETPVWRFMATPGVFGEFWTAGIFLASVDAVGRQYPLVVGFAAPTLALLAHGPSTLTALDAAEGLAREALLDLVPVDAVLDRMEGIAQRLFTDQAAKLSNPAAFAVRMLGRLESAPWAIESCWWVAGGGQDLQIQMEGALSREGLAQLFRPPSRTMSRPADAPTAAEPAAVPVSVSEAAEPSVAKAASPVVSDEKPADPAAVSDPAERAD